MTCPTCSRDPAKVNAHDRECSHVDCPNRRRAWSERPTAESLYTGPWPANNSRDPTPLDGALTFGDNQ